MAVYTSYPHSSDRYLTQNEVSKPPLKANTTFFFAMMFLLFEFLVVFVFMFVRIVKHACAETHASIVSLQDVEVHTTFAPFPKGRVVG